MSWLPKVQSDQDQIFCIHFEGSTNCSVDLQFSQKRIEQGSAGPALIW